MKKLIIVCSLLVLASVGYAATPREVGSIKASKIALTPRTLAQIEALTADTTGQLVLCIDCVRSAVCVSSGSVNPGAWVILTASGPFVGGTFSGMAACQ